MSTMAGRKLLIGLMAFLLLVAASAAPRVAAQEDTTTVGREFFFAFTSFPRQTDPDQTWDEQRIYLFISSSANASGTIQFTDSAYSDIPFTVTAGGTTTVELPRETGDPHPVAATPGVSNNSIRISANRNIAVYALWWAEFQTDALLIPPTTSAGTLFVVPSYASPSSFSSWGGNTAGFVVVAQEDDTTVTYIAREAAVIAGDGAQTVELYQSGAVDTSNAESVTLDRGEVFVYQTASTVGDESDISGSIVEADRPITVYGYSTCANVPFGSQYCDYLMESVPPVPTWGTEYVAPPAANRTYQDTYRGYAWQDNTVVSLNGSELITLAAGEFFEYRQQDNSALVFSANQPFLLMRYFNSTQWDSQSGDPSMLTMISLQSGLKRVQLTTANVDGITYTHALTVVRPRDAAVTMNGSALTDWQQITGTDFDYKVLEDVPTGAYEFVSSQLLQVYVSGLRSDESYAYPGGMNLRARWSPDSLLGVVPAVDGIAAPAECALTPDMAVSPQFIELAPGGTATVEIAMRNLCNDAPYRNADLLVSFSDGLRVIDGSNGMLNLLQRAAWQGFTLAPGETRRWTVTVQADGTLAVAPVHISELYHTGRVVNRIDGVFITPAPAPAEQAPAPAEPAPVPAAPVEPAPLPAALPNTAGESVPFALFGLLLALGLISVGVRTIARR